MGKDEFTWDGMNFEDHIKYRLSACLSSHTGEAFWSITDAAETFARGLRPIKAQNFLLAFAGETKKTHEYFYGVLDTSVNPFADPETFASLVYRKYFGDILHGSATLRAQNAQPEYPARIALTPDAVAAVRKECGLPMPRAPAEIRRIMEETELALSLSRRSPPGRGEKKECAPRESKERRTAMNTVRESEERRTTMNTVHVSAQTEPYEGKEYFRARASITLNNMLTVKGMSVWARKDGTLYVKMPEKDRLPENYDGNRDAAYPITKELREKISAVVLAEYGRAIEQQDGIDVKVYPADNGSHIKATASAVFDEAFAITGIAVVENGDGELFVRMPQHSFESASGKTEYRDIVEIPPHIKGVLKHMVLTRYAEERSNAEEGKSRPAPKESKAASPEPKPVGLKRSKEKDIRGEAAKGGKPKSKEKDTER